MIRAFIAVELEPTEQMRAIARELKEMGCDLKVVNLQQIHITLRFLGDIEENMVYPIAGAIKSCAASREFVVKLRGMGAFPNLNYINVVWIGISNPAELERMSTCINAKLLELGFPEADKPFAPHITVARVKGKRNLNALQKLIKENGHTNFGDVQVNAVHLKKSVLTPQGPIYTNLFTQGFG
ncbi:MAG: RNA 2',3'-cyclic phosphodiesterase [Thermoplasmata archaeon]|nr:RNA 2',3'-cyclic phosphodiesterase [Thermoplasmata archaeon]